MGRHHLGEHFSPVMALVALPYLLWPNAQVLMFLQATAVWATVMLVLWQAGRELHDAQIESAFQRWLGMACVGAMLLVYPPLLATWAAQFQPIELGAPLVALALLVIRYDRLRWLWLIVPLLPQYT